MTATRSAQCLVYIYKGTIFLKDKKNEGKLIEIEGRFDCYTPEVDPNELYEFIDKNNPDSLPYSVVGRNICDPELVSSRPYHDD